MFLNHILMPLFLVWLFYCQNLLFCPMTLCYVWVSVCFIKHHIKRVMVSAGIAPCTLLTTALGEGQWSASCPQLLDSWQKKKPSPVPTVYVAGPAGMWTSCTKEISLAPPGNQTPVPWLLCLWPSHCTNWITAAPPCCSARVNTAPPSVVAPCWIYWQLTKWTR